MVRLNKMFIWLAGAAMLLSIAASPSFAQVAQSFYFIQHWLTGRVADAPLGGDAAGRTLELRYSAADPRAVEIVLPPGRPVPDGSFQVDMNQLNPDWYVTGQPTNVMFRMLPPGAPPRFGVFPRSVALTSRGVQPVIPDLAMAMWDGPGLTLTTLFQGRYNPLSDAGLPTTVVVEARNPDGPDSPENASLVAGTATMTLGADGQGSVTFAGLANGPYYLQIRDELAGLSRGNHLPVITSGRIMLTDGIFATVNISDPANPDFQPVWVRPGSDYENPLFIEPGGRRSIKGGDYSNDAWVRIDDYQSIGNPELNWLRPVAPPVGGGGAAEPQADMDGDGTIGLPDTQIIGGPQNWNRKASIPGGP